MLQSVPWSESFATSVRNALGSDSLFIQSEVARDVCQIWDYIIDHEIVAQVVTREESDTLVIVAYEGSHLKEFGRYMFDLAVEKRIPYVRFHTQKPGLIKILAEFNPEPLEYVIRVNCYGR